MLIISQKNVNEDLLVNWVLTTNFINKTNTDRRNIFFQSIKIITIYKNYEI